MYLTGFVEKGTFILIQRQAINMWKLQGVRNSIHIYKVDIDKDYKKLENFQNKSDF